MSNKKLDTTIRKEQIAEAAADLLSEQGFRGLKMIALAERVGLVPSAIYRHFKTKEDVLFAALDSITERLVGGVIAVCQETPDPIERLRLLLMRQGRMIIENKVYPRMVGGDEIYRGHPERREKVYESIRRYVSKISSVIHEGQMKGQIRKDVDAITLSLIFVGLWRGSLPFYVHSYGKFNLTNHLEKSWRFFSEAIKEKKTNPN